MPHRHSYNRSLGLPNILLLQCIGCRQSDIGIILLKRIGVIANRVSGNLRPFEPLELFLSRLEIPIISQLGNLTCDDLPQGYNPSWKLTDGYSYMLDRMGWPPLIRWIWDAIDAEAVNRPLMTLGEPMTDRVAIKQQDQILEKA